MEANIPKIQIDAIENNGEKANPSETPKQGDLTPEEENYLKKELLSRAIHKEVLFLKEETSLARLDRLTILKFFFANYLAEFPLLRKTKKKFWDKMQTLSANMEQLKLSNAIERGEETSGDKIFRRVERKIVLVMNSAIKITSSDWLQQAQASRQAATEGLFTSVQSKEDFEAKIYATRKVSEKRMTGTVTKMNYIIISTFGDKQGIVARSMSEIEELHSKLKKEFKEIKLPSMPKKIKVRNPSAEMIEKRRKDLNYYIRNILIHEEIRKCELVRTFLFEDMTHLSDTEQQNVDKTREQEVQDQLKEAALQKDIEDRTNQMFKVTSEFFEYLAANGGFPTFIKTLKDNPDMKGLPENYQRLFELARLKISFLVYNTLHRDDGHQEAFEKFKSLYNIIPFTALVVILKISNPFLLLRGLFELFLARPFGAKSLMQRMLSLSMNDDMKEAKSEKVKMLEELGNNQDLAKKVENFVNNEEARRSISVTEIEEMSEEQYVKLVLTCDKIEPPISSQFINNLTEEQIEKIYQLIGMEFAARDAKLLISFMGNSEITDVIKEMFTMFYLPLVELYKKVDLGQLIKTVASYMKAVIAVAEANKREVDGRKIFQQYLQIFKEHEQGIYKFVNELLTQEAGILRELITWGYDFFEFMRLGNSEKPIDVNKFVTNMVGEDKEKLGLLKKEVQAVKEFHIARHRRRAERLKYILTTLDKNQVGDAAGTSNWEFLDDEDEDEEDDVEHADENGNNTNSDVTPRRQAKNGNKSPKQEVPEHLKKIPAPKLTLVPTLVEAFVPLVADGLSRYKPKIVSVQTPWERIDGADKDPYLDLLQESSGEEGKESKSKTKSRSKSISKGKTPREVSSEATTPKEDKKDRLSPQDLKESKSVPNSPRESQGDGNACNQQ